MSTLGDIALERGELIFSAWPPDDEVACDADSADATMLFVPSAWARLILDT